MFGMGMGELIILAIILVGIAFWLWMLVDCLQNEAENKLVWVVVLVFLHLLGALVYWGLRYRGRRLTQNQA